MLTSAIAPTMTDNTLGSGVNFLKLHLDDKCNKANIKIEEVNYEVVIKTETEVVGGLGEYQNIYANELLQNENDDNNLKLGNSTEQLLNRNSEFFSCEVETWDIKQFEDYPEIDQRITNLSPNYQKADENREKYNKVGLDANENLLGQDMALIDHVEINAEDLKLPAMLPQHCENETISNHSKSKKQKKATRKISKLDFRKYKCNECSYAAVRKGNLEVHIKCRHTMEKSYKCNECSYTAVRKRDLIFHIKSRHTMEKDYKCNKCSYAAICKDRLQAHTKSCHIMEKSYKCNECSYAAVRKRDLLVHIKSRHTMEKDYKCKECSYAAVCKNSLHIHIKTCHIQEKIYKCNECSYSAVQKDVLRTHIKRHHSQERPYKCNECSYTAVRKDYLQGHIKSHHIMKKTYKCNKCFYATVRKGCLQAHINSLHSIDKTL